MEGSVLDRTDFAHDDNIGFFEDDSIQQLNDGDAWGLRKRRSYDPSDVGLDDVPLTPSDENDPRPSNAMDEHRVVPYSASPSKSRHSSNHKLVASSAAKLTRGYDFLSSFVSPPARPKNKPLYSKPFSVDNRARTPSLPISKSCISTSSIRDSDRDNDAALNVLIPSHYYNPPIRSPNKDGITDKSSLESPSPARLAFDACTPSSAESASTNASFVSHGSSEKSRRYSYSASFRSSTSASLIQNEVITLGGCRTFGSPQSSASPAIISRFDTRRVDDSDLESQADISQAAGSNGWLFQKHEANKSILSAAAMNSRLYMEPNSVFRLMRLIQSKSIHFGNLSKKKINEFVTISQSVSERFFRRYEGPDSDSPRELRDLDYLQQSHRAKVGRLSEDSEEIEHFDFVIVLSPQEAYAYWSELLDFQVEHLGNENNADAEIGCSNSSTSNETSDSESETGSPASKISDHEFRTPVAGVHQHRGKQFERSTGRKMSLMSDFRDTSTKSGFDSSNFFSPSGYPSTGGTKRVKSRLSMFEKAVGMTSPSGRRLTNELSRGSFVGETPPLGSAATDSRQSTSSVRRRWGNHAMAPDGTGPSNMLSPPVRSLTRGAAASVRKLRMNATPSNDQNIPTDESGSTPVTKNPNSISIEDIPTQIIPRGIAARTNGMLQFLSALKRGIVLRRHRPNASAVFCKIFSTDGGDTIHYQYVDAQEAMVAFKEQRIRYNRKLTVASSPNTVKSNTRQWSCLDVPGDGSPVHKFKIPDHIAAQRYREKLNKEFGFTKRLANLATRAANSGMVRASEIVAVQPARHQDPRSRKGEFGSSSLRRSKAEFCPFHTFSLVASVGQRFTKKKTAAAHSNENRWFNGEGKDIQYRSLDLEAATEGEYWLIFRGFLLLHRDAAVGRYATERRAGIGGGVRRDRDRDASDGDGEDDEIENRLHRDEFFEPATVNWVEKQYVKIRKLDETYMKGYVLPSAVPPPSDYFLGFRTPGTQIWSRLRLAGFETRRVYSVFNDNVMIKVRCPEDRLLDVAEVLRIKMKTLEGRYAPFQETNADIFEPRFDPSDAPLSYQGTPASLLRSKDRQSIIDFIMGSRIRDSGAELGQTTELGSMVMARVPLHMHKKLDSLCSAWVFYWRRENWTERDGRSLTTDSAPLGDPAGMKSVLSGGGDPEDKKIGLIPNCLVRFFVGAFYQPLDSVEQYFGEQVSFYFAWLQHCAYHLVFLSVCGIIVTICQLASKNVDHPIRPFFAVVVMVWTFVVLTNWRKRSNFLAYRWGTMDYKVQETTRPEFRGAYVRDSITQEWVVTYPSWKRWLKYLLSIPISLGFAGLAMILILLVHANRDIHMHNYIVKATGHLSNSGSNGTNFHEMNHFSNETNVLQPIAEELDHFIFDFSLKAIGRASELASQESAELPVSYKLLLDPSFLLITIALPAMLGLCIPIMNVLLMNISMVLNDFENYRTESEYRTHLIIKVFGFRFVSQFGTLYYYAFMSMKNITTIESGILRMGTSVLIYTTVAHWWQIILQVYLFMLVRHIRRIRYKRKLRSELRLIELEEESIAEAMNDSEDDISARQQRLINKRILLDQAQDDIWFETMNPPHTSFPEYITAVVQFSFVACFSVVLPITPVLCLFNYLLSMRYDAYKLCRGRQRPLAQKTGGIGVWEHLLHIVAVIAVLTNCWLIGFTSSYFVWLADEERLGTLGLFAFVVGWEHIMLLVKYILQTATSSLPRSVRDAVKRDQHKSERMRHKSMQSKTRKSRRRRRSKFESSDASLSYTHTEDEEDIDDETTTFHQNSILPTIPSVDDDESSSGLFSA